MSKTSTLCRKLLRGKFEEMRLSLLARVDRLIVGKLEEVGKNKH